MKPKIILTYLLVAALAFALGWGVATSGASTGTSGPAYRFDAEPTAALATILRIEDPSERATQLAAFLAQTDPSAALILHEVLREKGSDLIIDEIAEILFAHWWARSDPATAFRNPVNPAWEGRHPWMRSVLRLWVRQDPIAAAVAANSLPNGPLKGRLEASRVVVDEWLRLDSMPEPTALLGVIKSLEPMARGGAIQHFLASMIRDRGVDATLDFVRSVPPDHSVGGSVQHEFLARAGIVLIDVDVDRAVAWAAEQRGGENAPGVHKHLAYYWGLKDGRSATEWALALPDLPYKPAAIKRAWMSFTRKHREEAKAWMLSRPPDALMRGVYTKFLKNLAKEDAQAAMRLAEKTVDPTLRDVMRASAGEGWMQSDPKAAAAWLESAGLPRTLEAQVRLAGRASKES